MTSSMVKVFPGVPEVANLRFLVIGCGSIGQRHLRNLRRLGVEDILAMEVRKERRQEVEKQFGVPVFADLHSALGREPQVALVCTPTNFHLENALAAAGAGCHLFIEKPLAGSLSGLPELLAEIERRHLLTLVGCNFRFHPGLLHVKALLETGGIGTVVAARAQFGQYLPDWHPWEDYHQGYSAQRVLGGGVVLDRIHELDYLRWLLGDINEVCAMVGHLSHLELDTEDTAEILVRFVSGGFGSIHLDYVRRTYDCRLEIIGDAGTIQWCYQENFVRWYLALEGLCHSLEWPLYDGNEMYLEEMRHFLRVLQGQEPSKQDAVEGARVLALALAVLKAASERRVIAV